MKTINDIKKTLEYHKKDLIKKYGLKLIAVFGSYSRNEQTLTSDVDILVEFSKPIGIEFIDLANELENILNMKVDLVSKNGIKSRYYVHIKNDLIYV
jgi:hypothetical protein